MPAPISYAHRLMERQAELRRSGALPWLRPDAKSQVTFAYENGKPVRLDAVVLSTQHDPEIIVYHYENGQYTWGISMTKNGEESVIKKE